MDMRLEQVLAAARARRAALTVETAGYIALGVADALAVSPGVVRETDVVLDAEGNVTVSGAARSEDAHAAERSVRTMLQKLLSVCAGASMAPTFRPGDRLTFEPSRRVQVGDVALIAGPTELVAHRIRLSIGGVDSGWCVHCGDAPGAVPGIAANWRVVGRLARVARTPPTPGNTPAS